MSHYTPPPYALQMQTPYRARLYLPAMCTATREPKPRCKYGRLTTNEHHFSRARYCTSCPEGICSNGLPGKQSGDYCCAASCDECSTARCFEPFVVRRCVFLSKLALPGHIASSEACSLIFTPFHSGGGLTRNSRSTTHRIRPCIDIHLSASNCWRFDERAPPPFSFSQPECCTWSIFNKCSATREAPCAIDEGESCRT